MNLFRKNIEKRCAYCACGCQINSDLVACRHKGIVEAGGHCFHFSYDPLRRTPPRPAALKAGRYRAEDFQI